ncbi:hypothetical protein GOP47_0019086 [Adiantum capillus-veneris]|uniref:Uncharacterized protein n=1 Tax=Adiantum capillus-veneris TaxID=13818 RepID=A0A9D4UF02_ADICA|nr:hypothetical protein GOP47_0019086 [Adiantum capillus-veneris]
MAQVLQKMAQLEKEKGQAILEAKHSKELLKQWEDYYEEEDMEEELDEYGIIDVLEFQIEGSLTEVTLDTYMVNVDDLSTKNYEPAIVPYCGTQSISVVSDT